ncbi:MAG: glycosyltransferase family 2 protein [Candidatus Chlorobium antarcticum]|nr:glycosyltransferase family 2 protein [Candidatus Chlorobium antarcticum]
MLLFYQLLVLGALIVLGAILISNLIELRPLPPVREGSEGNGPMVSVLVPARNEEDTISRCIGSLQRQKYHDFEILVLDDGSTDRTAEILRQLETDGGGRVRTYSGEPLPEGWHGKSWACFQLAREARGDMFLFTDADTAHESDALSRSVAALHESGADMLSLTPFQELGSFWEKVVVPMVYVILVSLLPLRLVRSSQRPSFCFANGQFILFRRDFYSRFGGHEAVRCNLVEDVWLCMKVKSMGGRVAAFNGTDALSCRMYRNFREVWAGFSKNLFAGLSYSIPSLVGMISFTLLLFVAPWIFMLTSVVAGSFGLAEFLLPLLQIVLVLLSRVLIAFRFRQSVAFAMLDPLARLVLVAIALNSFRLMAWSSGAEWKGRRYKFS